MLIWGCQPPEECVELPVLGIGGQVDELVFIGWKKQLVARSGSCANGREFSPFATVSTRGCPTPGSADWQRLAGVVSAVCLGFEAMSVTGIRYAKSTPLLGISLFKHDWVTGARLSKFPVQIKSDRITVSGKHHIKDLGALQDFEQWMVVLRRDRGYAITDRSGKAMNRKNVLVFESVKAFLTRHLVNPSNKPMAIDMTKLKGLSQVRNSRGELGIYSGDERMDLVVIVLEARAPRNRVLRMMSRLVSSESSPRYTGMPEGSRDPSSPGKERMKPKDAPPSAWCKNALTPLAASTEKSELPEKPTILPPAGTQQAARWGTKADILIPID